MDVPAVWRIYMVPLVLGVVSLVFISLSIIIFIKSYQVTEPITFSSDEATQSAVQSPITIDIEGAVMKPGVYELPSGSRVDDAIVGAGGFSPSVDTDVVAKTFNRAARLSDGAKLYIPMKNSSQVQSAPSIPSSLISINAASESDLDKLSGIGPVTAAKIIAGRPYMRLEELVEKKALSQSAFIKLKDQLTL